MPRERLSFSALLVSQGTHRFYTLTVPSDVLAKTCFVTSRDENPRDGFQRLLDRKRAQDIADYIDAGLGTIPTSIVLSAQEVADLKYVRKTKTVEFWNDSKAFLVLDGQHRVYGFSLAKTELRVPVVVYSGLSRRDETRLFIDINTKQRPVRNELLLDIKSLAEYENDEEQQLRAIFDVFHEDPASPLYGLLSSSDRAPNKISRVTFNAAVRSLLSVMSSLTDDQARDAISAYLSAVTACLQASNSSEVLTKSVTFKAIMRLFPDVSVRVKDRHGQRYTSANFLEVLQPAFSRVQLSRLRSPGTNVQALYEHLKRSIETGFQL